MPRDPTGGGRVPYGAAAGAGAAGAVAGGRSPGSPPGGRGPGANDQASPPWGPPGRGPDAYGEPGAPGPSPRRGDLGRTDLGRGAPGAGAGRLPGGGDAAFGPPGGAPGAPYGRPGDPHGPDVRPLGRRGDGLPPVVAAGQAAAAPQLPPDLDPNGPFGPGGHAAGPPGAPDGRPPDTGSLRRVTATSWRGGPLSSEQEAVGGPDPSLLPDGGPQRSLPFGRRSGADPRDPTGGGRAPGWPDQDGPISGSHPAVRDRLGRDLASGQVPSVRDPLGRPPGAPRDPTGGGRVPSAAEAAPFDATGGVRPVRDLRDPTGGGRVPSSAPAAFGSGPGDPRGPGVDRDPTGGGRVPSAADATAAYETVGLASPAPPPDPRQDRRRVQGTPGAPGPGPAFGAPAEYGDDGYDDEYDDDLYEDDGGDGTGSGADGEGGTPGRRRKVVLGIILVMVLLAGALAFTGWNWVQSQIDPPGGQGEQVVIEIPSGSSTAQIGEWLARGGVIRNANVWTWYTRLNDPGSIQAGTYELHRNSSYDQAIEALQAGPAAPEGLFVTIPEGYTVSQAVGRIADPEDGIEGFTAEGLDGVLASGSPKSRYVPADQPSHEGTLFPETYRLEEDQTEADLIAQMIGEFDATMAELDVDNRAAALERSPYEIVIIASLIEEEAALDEERAMISGVIYNRLEDGEPLGIDATSCYEKGEVNCSLTSADFESDSPYNTRRNQGLPPTPISSPGRASLEAALAPAEHDFKYYALSDDEGHHTFTATYEEHLEAVEVCRDQGLC